MKNTKKKVLFVATVDSHIELFHLPYLKMFKDKGYEVHVATNTDKKIQYCDKKHKISIARSPFKLCNLKAIRQLKKIVNEEHFDIIHCHTPMGGVVARLAAKKARKNGTRVIYTAHGFHFYKGAPLKNWLLFYPVEKYLAKYTDILITINNEDYERAKKKFEKRCFDIQYVPGVGVDEKKFKKKLTEEEKHNLRKSLGLKDDDYVMIFPAELSKRKNQMWLIKTLKPVFDEDKKKHLLLPGKDSLNGKCQKLTKKLGLENQVHFLGFRNDIDKLLKISDLAVSSSKQEGLPVNLIEAAFCGLPIVATDCRGNRDVVSVAYSSDGFKDAVIKSQSKTQENYNTDQFSMDDVFKKMDVIYSSELMKFNTPSKNIVIKALKKIRQKIMLKKNKIGAKKRNKAINNKQITIISNNCFAGIAYEHLDLPFNSPTIGLYFFAKDYIKFINNLKSYLKKELVEIKPSESKYYDELIRLGQENVIIGKLGDIEIVFLHYKSFSEAKEKWTRRCKRVDFDNIMYTFNDQNLCTENDLKAFHEFKAANKVCFTAKKYEYPEFVQIEKYEKLGIVKDGAFGWYKYFDLVGFIKNNKQSAENKNNKLLFSIIVPAYNSEEYLSDCLDSLLRQNYSRYEIIVIDDGSTDKTPGICDEYSKHFKNVKVIHQKNTGVSIARSNGVATAKGEYLLFCDSDDMFCDGALSELSQIVERTNADVVCFGMSFNIAKCEKNGTGNLYTKEQIETKLFPRLLEDKNGKYLAPQICCGAFKRKLYSDNQVDEYKIDLGEDLACKKAVLYNAKTIYISGSKLYYYRRHDKSTTMKRKVFLTEGPKNIGKHLESKIDTNKFDMEQQVSRVVTHQLFLVLLSQFNNNKYDDNKRIILDALNDGYYEKQICKCSYSIKNYKGVLAKTILKHKMIFALFLISKIKYAGRK